MVFLNDEVVAKSLRPFSPDKICSTELGRGPEEEQEEGVLVGVEQADRLLGGVRPVGGQVQPPRGRHEAAGRGFTAPCHQYSWNRDGHLNIAVSFSPFFSVHW